MQTLRDLIARLASWKVNQVQLYIEHTYAYPGHEEVWRDASPFTADEIRELDRFCQDRHVELVPNQNTLGHMERWLRHERYRPLALAPDGWTDWKGRTRPPTTLDPSKPGSLRLAREMLDTLLPQFDSRRVHVGLDEPWELPRSRVPDYIEWIRELPELAELPGYELLIWGDVPAGRPALLAELPTGVTVCEWGYDAGHPFDKHAAAYERANVPSGYVPVRRAGSASSVARRTCAPTARRRWKRHWHTAGAAFSPPTGVTSATSSTYRSASRALPTPPRSRGVSTRTAISISRPRSTPTCSTTSRASSVAPCSSSATSTRGSAPSSRMSRRSSCTCTSRRRSSAPSSRPVWTRASSRQSTAGSTSCKHASRLAALGVTTGPSSSTSSTTRSRSRGWHAATPRPASPVTATSRRFRSRSG